MPRDTGIPVAQSPYAIKAGVGANKTKSAIEYIKNNPDQRFIYAAPTVMLIQQTQGHIERALAGQGREVTAIHMGAKGDSDSVREALLGALNGPLNHGAVVLCSSMSLLAVVAKIKNHANFALLVDEAFAPVDFYNWHLGVEAEKNWHRFNERFEVMESGQVVLNFETLLETQAVIEGGVAHGGQDSLTYRDLAAQVQNDALHVEIVANDAFTECKAGRASEVAEAARKRATETGKPDRTALRLAIYPTPVYFGKFKEVIFLSALFERSLFHGIWTHHFKVHFEKHPAFPETSMRQLHTLQGPYVEIGHILTDGERASKENLKASADTGGEVGKGSGEKRRLDQALEIASDFFAGEEWIVTINSNLGYDSGPAKDRLLARKAVKIPTISHGSNEYKGIRHGAALAVTNPAPPEATWYKAKTGLTTQEVHHRHRLHTVYQTLGRTAVRAESPDASTKRWLVWSEDEAKALCDIWKGSKYLGQVGGDKAMKSRASLAGPPPVKQAGKTASLAAEIRKVLHQADPKVKEIHLPTLKKKAAPEVDKMLWSRAVAAATKGTAWGREGHWLKR